MHMQDYNKILRLKAGDKLGNRHIAVKRHTYSAYPQHWHNYFEIEIVTEGTGSHILNGTPYPICKGDIYLLTPVDFHEINSANPIELINISFDEVWLTENVQTLLYTSDFVKIRHFQGADYSHLIKIAELLQYECESGTQYVNQLLEYLLGRFMIRDDTPNEQIASKAQLTGIKKAVSYIDLHFREKITLELLSAISGYSPTYFSELFRKFTGETYIDRVTTLRINYAKALLSKGLSVSEACSESGFGSLSNFLAVFKAKCGVPPSQYRKQFTKPH